MRVFKHVIPGFLAVNFYFSVSVSAPTVDNSVTSSLANQASQAERLDAIKEAFQHTWKGYQHCFGSDGFFPSFSVPGTKPYWKCTSGDSNWGEMAFQALNTAIIMELPDVVNQILDFISSLDLLGHDKTKLRGRTMDFTKGTSIYMGSMLGAYDLLNGEYKGLVKDTSKIDMLLKLSVIMADRFKKDWNTTTGLPPWGYLVENVPDHLPTPNTRRTISAPQTAHKTDPERGIYRTRSGSVALGNLGKIVLEWCHLSTLTGDTSYCTLAQQTESLLINSKKPQVAETFPGLLSIFVRDSSYHINSNEKPNPEKSYGFDEIITWSTVGGQYYENLLKMYLYDSAKYAVYKQRWLQAAESAIKHLLKPLPVSSPSGPLNALSFWNDTKLAYQEDESSCSAAGQFILGGTLFSRPSILEAGKSLLRTCHHLRTSTASGLAPSEFHWSSQELEKAGKQHPNDYVEWDVDWTVPWSGGKWNYTASKEFFNKNGFWFYDGSNALTKATPESYYYAYRTTKENLYRDWAWEEFLAINSTARVPSGFAPVDNVNSVKPGFPNDSLDGELSGSFLGQTLKYLFMVQEDPRSGSGASEKGWQVKVQGKQEYVFSSDGNIFRTPRIGKK